MPITDIQSVGFAQDSTAIKRHVESSTESQTLFGTYDITSDLETATASVASLQQTSVEISAHDDSSAQRSVATSTESTKGAMESVFDE